MNPHPHNDSSQRRVELGVYGQVQGVGFRAWTSGRAHRAGLTGQARNNSDGSVTVIAEGPIQIIDTLAAELADGQGPGRVDHVNRQDLEPTGEYTTFEIG